MSQSRRIKPQTKQTHVIQCMVTVVSVFSWKFTCFLPSPFEENFQSKEFFEKWNDIEKPKKRFEKRKLAKNKWYNQMAQVGTRWSTWNKWHKEKRVFRSTWNKWNKEKGVFRSSWNKWNKDKGSVQLNLFTCSKVCLQGRAIFRPLSRTQNLRSEFRFSISPDFKFCFT